MASQKHIWCSSLGGFVDECKRCLFIYFFVYFDVLIMNGVKETLYFCQAPVSSVFRIKKHTCLEADKVGRDKRAKQQRGGGVGSTSSPGYIAGPCQMFKGNPIL